MVCKLVCTLIENSSRLIIVREILVLVKYFIHHKNLCESDSGNTEVTQNVHEKERYLITTRNGLQFTTLETPEKESGLG